MDDLLNRSVEFLDRTQRAHVREALVQEAKTDWENAEVSAKLKALLHIAGKIQQNGKLITEDDVATARREGATDREIHDMVLIAAVFCMCNRYVDGLATWAPHDPGIYRSRAAEIVEHGYVAVTAAATAAVNGSRELGDPKPSQPVSVGSEAKCGRPGRRLLRRNGPAHWPGLPFPYAWYNYPRIRCTFSSMTV